MDMVEREEGILGRGIDDHERLFPKYTQAQAASVGEVVVNGKTLKIWEFTQLETLKPAVLRQRAMAIRDALGEASCPAMPSAQAADIIRWILHMQSTLTGIDDSPCRNAMQGPGPSPSFYQEAEGRGLIGGYKPAPFGTRRATGEMEATRDHFSDLMEKKKEFKEVTELGIATMRVGGEGRRHIFPRDSMVNEGISSASPAGIESMKEQGEGRRHIDIPDHIFTQQRELEAIERGVSPQLRRPRQGPESMRRGGQDMHRILMPDDPSDPLNRDPIQERPIGGERKKHVMPEDHMLNNGTADAVEGSVGHGRKHIDTFAGRTQMKGSLGSYKSTWKQDPSRLMGTSLIC